MRWTPIDITEIGGFRIGNAQDPDAMTGVTAIVFDKPCVGGIDVSGGGPACREPYLLSPLCNPQSIHALLLSGGSAFGLDAAGGAMRYLEEHGRGFPVGGAMVPLVVQSCIFDLPLGNAHVRPNAQMGYDACVDAERNQPCSGNLGGGTGATVGKLCGMPQSQKAGIGYFAAQVGELKIGAVSVVNALGDIYDPESGQKIAGVTTPDRSGFLPTGDILCGMQLAMTEHANTTISAIFTNARLTQPEMGKVAAMARAAYGQCIRPVGTMADGDTIYAFSVDGSVQSDISIVGALAVEVLGRAIRDAVTSARMDDDAYLKLI